MATLLLFLDHESQTYERASHVLIVNRFVPLVGLASLAVKVYRSLLSRERLTVTEL